MLKITVLMPIHNGEEFLQEALQSLLGQTFQSFEILAIDDASTDDSFNILSSCSDERLRALRNDKNIGVANSLNRGIQEIRSEYIVRMDADDIALPDRLARQVAFMDSSPQVGISGTWAKYIGQYEGTLEKRPCGEDVVKAFMVFDNPLMHPTVIMRNSSLASNGLMYDQSFERCEDFDLWERGSRHFAITNIGNPLLHLRIHPESVTRKHSTEVFIKTHEVLRRGLMRIGIVPDQDQLEFHQRIGHGESLQNLVEIGAAEVWLRRVEQENKKCCVHSPSAMHEALSFVWYRLCRNSSLLGTPLWSIYNKSTFADRSLKAWKNRFDLAIAVLFHSLRKKLLKRQSTQS